MKAIILSGIPGSGKSTFAGQADKSVICSATVLELAPYVAVANAYNYKIELVTFLCDPEVGAKRNKHKVPYAACLAMDNRLVSRDREIPVFWKLEKKVIRT